MKQTAHEELDHLGASPTDTFEELLRRIKKRAALFCVNNLRYSSASDILVIENAMMIGAILQLSIEQEKLVVGNKLLLDKAGCEN